MGRRLNSGLKRWPQPPVRQTERQYSLVLLRTTLTSKLSHSTLPLNQCCGSALVSVRTRIRIRHFLSMRIRVKIQGLMAKNWKKCIAIFCNFVIYLSLSLHKGHPSYRRSLHPSKKCLAFQNLNFLHFWVIFPLLGPDPAEQNTWHCFKFNIYMKSKPVDLDTHRILSLQIDLNYWQINILKYKYLLHHGINI